MSALNEDLPDEKVEVSLQELRALVEQRIKEHQDKVAGRHNRRHRKPRSYKEGDLALLKAEHPATGESRKLLPRYRGVYQVTKVLLNDRYEVSDTKTTQVSQKPFVSDQAADKIKPFIYGLDSSCDDMDSDNE